MNPLRNLGYYNRIQGCCLGVYRGSDLKFNCNGAAASSPLWHDESCASKVHEPTTHVRFAVIHPVAG